MANVISKLFVTLGLDAKGFKQEFNNVAKSLHMSSKQLTMVAGAATAMGAAITTGIALSIKEYARAGDEIQKMALRTGFATEALSELRHAAELSGTSLSAVETAAKLMSRTIYDAGNDSLSAKRALGQLGLSVGELINMKPEEQFMTIASAIANVENPTIRSAMALEIFGRSGTELLPMLANGSEGLARMREDARKLGIVFDQEAADKAAAFNDSMTRLIGTINGVKYAIGEALVPIITDFVDKITPFISSMTEWAKQNKDVATGLTMTIAGLGGLLTLTAPLLVFAMFLEKIVHYFKIIGPALLAAFHSPLVALLAAITAIGIALGLLYVKWTEFVESIKIPQAIIDFANWMDKYLSSNKILPMLNVPASYNPLWPEPLSAAGVSVPTLRGDVSWRGGEGYRTIINREFKIEIVQNIAGSVITERELIDKTREGLLDILESNASLGFEK